MDNISPHTSRFILEVLNIAKIIRFLWPAQSPDINPIEHIWKYIRKLIRQRQFKGTYPKTKKEIWTAWEEKWSKTLQKVING